MQNAAFTILNDRLDKKGHYVRLVDFGDSELKRTKTLEAIQNPECGWFYTANQKDFEKIPGSPVGYWLSETSILHFSMQNLKKYTEPKQGLITSDNNQFLRYWFEVALIKTSLLDSNLVTKWYGHNKGGEFRKWFGNLIYVVNWENNGYRIKNFVDEKGKQRSRPQNIKYYFREGVTWTDLTQIGVAARYLPRGNVFDGSGPTAFMDKKYINYILGLINFKYTARLSQVLNPTLHFTLSDFGNIPFIYEKSYVIEKIVEACKNISILDWNTRETSWDFQRNELIRHQSIYINEAYNKYKNYWTDQFNRLHRNEEELNRQFIEIYGLKDELKPDVPLDEITILQEELNRKQLKQLDKQRKLDSTNSESHTPSTNHYPPLPFDDKEVMAQLVSYAVGCMMGRYSLDKEGLILANQGEDLEDYLSKVGRDVTNVSFLADSDNVIPVMDEKWFDDDIVSRFREFIRVAFGEDHLRENMNFLTQKLGSDIRRYFVREFYNDHIKRYKKRPIYWMLSSPEGHFRVLIYMHRYTPDTLSIVLNKYLNPLIEMLETQKVRQQHISESGGDRERRQAEKEVQRLDKMIQDCKNYRQDTLYPLALKRIAIDLDDGVLVNYNKFGKVVAEVKGLNDKKAKAKVRKFDWIDVSGIV